MSKFLDLAPPVSKITSKSSEEILSSHEQLTTSGFLLAALFWLEFGFDVIPLVPKEKRSAVKWDDWLENLTVEKITSYWTNNPDHEVGFIVGNDYIVFDADSPESLAKLHEIEEAFDVSSDLIVKTRKGEHHYFRLAEGVHAKSDAHSSKLYPDRLDVKTGRGLVVMAPSTGKEVEICEVDRADDLTEVDQVLLDAIAKHNGRQAPRPAQPSALSDKPRVQTTSHKQLVSMLAHIPADCGYDDWLKVLLVIYHETGGSTEGLEIAIDWSSTGKSYKGRSELESKWRSFKSNVANPVTVRTLTNMLEQRGVDWMAICSEFEESFELNTIEAKEAVIDFKVKVVENPSVEQQDCNPFHKFSLRGQSAEIEKNLVEQVYVMDGIAPKGQYVMIYAAPNTGKTLFTLHLLTEAIKKGSINPDKLFYFNMDDTGNGLLEKNTIADEYGFHIITKGYFDFTDSLFLTYTDEMVKENSAKDVILVLDTTKFFVNLMLKNDASAFNQKIRPFVAKGGTVIALAHTNKNLDPSGKPKFCGTSDMVDDCDCAYILNSVSTENNVKVVEFENIKCRGNVLDKVAYQYTKEDDSSYLDILLSIAKVDENELDAIKRSEALKTDAELIDAVIATINDGIISKMKLAEAAAKRAGMGKGKMNKLIDKYTGENPDLHRWKYSVGSHGVKAFTLIDQTEIE